jgi:uncharacterized protein (TIGR00369 family)
VDEPLDLPVAGSYPDPRILRLSGMDRMDLINEGRSPRPPTHFWCGHVPTDWSPGRAAFAMPASPWFQVAKGLMSPGVVALPADAALGTAFATTVPPGVVTTTSELTINYLRPIRMKRLAARAALIDATPYQGLIESSVLDEDGRMVAHLTSRYVTLRPKVSLEDLQGDIPLVSDPPSEHGLHSRELPDDQVPPPRDDISGLEAFQRTASGEHPKPPVPRMLGMDHPKVSEGKFETTVPSSRWFTSPASTIYGGTTALVLEVAMTAAASTTLPAGWSCAPLDMKVQYLRPWLADGSLCHLSAEVFHRGRTMAVMRAEIRNAQGKPIAVATGSAMILQRTWSELAGIDALPSLAE